MSNLYNVTTTRNALLQFTKAFRDLADGTRRASTSIPAIRHGLCASRGMGKERSSARRGECPVL